MLKIVDLLYGLNTQPIAPPVEPIDIADESHLVCERPVPPESGQPPLPLTSRPADFAIWEEHAAALAIEQLQAHAHSASSEQLTHIAIELAELGLPGRAAQALLERLETHPEDGRCWGALGKVCLLAGKFEKAIDAAQIGLVTRLEPLVANKVIVKAQLLMGMTKEADDTLRSKKKRSSLVSSMVKHAQNLPLSPSVRAESNEIYPAEEIAGVYGWRGLAAPVVEWLNAAIARGAFLEAARLLRSPFIAPIRDDPELQRTIDNLGIDRRHLVAYWIDVSKLPGKAAPVSDTTSSHF